MNTLTIFKGTAREREVTPENVENLHDHLLDALDEVQVYKQEIQKWREAL